MKNIIAFFVLLLGIIIAVRAQAQTKVYFPPEPSTAAGIGQESPALQNQQAPSEILLQVVSGISTTIHGINGNFGGVRPDGNHQIIAIDDCGLTARLANPHGAGSQVAAQEIDLKSQEIQSRLVSALGRMR